MARKNANASTKKVEFQITAEPASMVFVAGTFNNWDPTQHRLHDNADNGVYRTKLTLSPGRYEYKFIVNGVWCADPTCSEWAPNGQGSLNSVVSV